jgi:hypothetical protein
MSLPLCVLFPVYIAPELLGQAVVNSALMCRAHGVSSDRSQGLVFWSMEIELHITGPKTPPTSKALCVPVFTLGGAPISTPFLNVMGRLVHQAKPKRAWLTLMGLVWCLGTKVSTTGEIRI